MFRGTKTSWGMLEKFPPLQADGGFGTNSISEKILLRFKILLHFKIKCIFVLIILIF